jgi:hypothetical protein
VAGCGAGGVEPRAAQPLQLSAPEPLALSVAHVVAQPLAVDRGQSWMAGDPETGPLVYVSDWSTHDVFVYNYKNHTMVGQLTGFKTPYGQCVDNERNVWIAEYSGRDLVEYAHGGKIPLKRLHTNGYPIGCAFDPSTGKLAAANFYSNSGPGDIEVWKHASGTPATYRSAKLYYLWPPAYDGRGNLFVEGRVYHAGYGTAELAKFGTELHEIVLKGATIRFAAGALWDGRYIGLTDQDFNDTNTTEVYRINVSGSTATVVGRVHLTDSCDRDKADVVQPFAVPSSDKQNASVVGGNLWCSNRFDFWHYPGGGGPAASLGKTPAEPFGESVSPADE